MYIGRTKNGIRCIIPYNTMEHLAAHPDVDIKHIAKAVEKIEYSGGLLKECVNLGENIGISTCVEVDDNDKVEYFYRKNRSGKTPMVFNRAPRKTSNIVIILRELKPTSKCPSGACALVTAYYGDLAPMEPWDAIRKNMTEEYIAECEDFWTTHALIFDPSVIEYK